MQILFVLENYYPNVGGVETLFKGLIEQLAVKGHKIKLITTRLDKSLPKIEHLDNITIYRYTYFNRYFFTIFALWPVIKYGKNADLIHTTSYNAAVPAILGALFRKKKTVITFHEVWAKLWFNLPFMNGFSKWLHYIFEQAIIKLPFTRFIAVSNFTKMKLTEAGITPSKITRIYNGIDYRKFPNKAHNSNTLNNEVFTICYYGRLGISKGLDIILEAAKTLKVEVANSKLILIIPKTPQPFFKKILQLIKQYQLQKYVELQHNLPQQKLYETLKSVDCVLIPSYSEGFCFAAAECVALGVPIISSHKGALKEVVSGKYIEMKDASAPGLVEAVKSAYNNDWEHKEIRKFYMKDSHEAYINLYEQMLDQQL